MELSKRFRYLIVLSIIGVTLALLYRFRDTLPVFVLALLMAYILTPFVTWMASKRVFKKSADRV